MVDIESLNREQRKAVLHDTGPVLVVAGAGTGKTAVISARIAYLITKRGVRPENILALTFTDKAATEMQDRVDSIISYGALDCDISTFHSLGDKILRENSHDIGLPSDFVVMSKFQQILQMQEVIEKLRLKYHKSLSNPYSFAESLLQFISKLKDENISPSKFDKFFKNRSKSLKKLDSQEYIRVNELNKIYKSYNEICLQKGLIDYGDQIVKVIELLGKNSSILNKYQKKYQYILIDEFQDTNYSQAYLVKLLTNKQQNIMVVGDDDQSIYRFRGANIKNILSFEEEYKDVKKIVLKKNYRSTQLILDKSYQFIQNNNPYRLEIEAKINKKLISSTKIKGELALNEYSTSIEEARQVAKSIADLNKSKVVELSEIAILLRKNNQAQLIGRALEEEGIDFVIAESLDLFEQPEIKTLLNIIQVINDPTASQAMYGLLVSDMYNISLDEIVEHSSRAARSHVPLEQYLKDNIKENTKVSAILTDVSQFRQFANQMSAGQLLYKYLVESGYLNRLIVEAETDSKSAMRIQNISQFFSLIQDFEKINSQNPDINSLWRYISNVLSSDAEVLIQPSPLDTNAVSILTVHRSKGLEFDTVYIVDLTEQTFPSTNRRDKIGIPEGLFNEDQLELNWHILEERRLFYVAMTRAKKRLYLSFARDHGGKRLKKPSRFVTEAFGENLVTKKVQNKSNRIDFITAFEKLPPTQKSPIAKYFKSDGWLHLSTNQIAAYLRSPKEFWYFDVLSLPQGPFHSLVYGTAIHAAIEMYYRSRLVGKIPNLDKLYEVYDKSWSSEGFVSLEHEKERYKKGRNTLKKFYQKQNKLSKIPQYIEKPFVLRLKDLKLEISGRYDAVFIDKTGCEIRDFKTSDVKDSNKAKNKLKESIQMQIYAMAWEESNGEAVSSISLHFVEHDIIAKSNKVSKPRTLRLLKEVSDGIRNSDFESKGASQVKLDRYL